MLDVPGESPNSVMYTVWDGSQWKQPIDIFGASLADGNPIVAYPHAILDDRGNIHLIWLQQPNDPDYAVYYSTAPASQAGSAKAWTKPVILADDLTGSKYSIHIAYTPPQTLHIAYARVAGGESPTEQRAVSYIRSTDGGSSWSKPVDVFTAPSLDTGASDTRLLVLPPDKVFLTWTLWDQSGNGQAIYFTRSLDNGLTWTRPIRLAVRQGLEYERDWNNLVWLGGNTIGALYEGGWRAYRYATYSSDFGTTWSEPIDIFPWLIGDNGYIEFARDGSDTVHLFVAQRIREGNLQRGDYFGLWHSVWTNGERWQEPILVTRDENAVKGMTNPKVAIINGNQIVTAWYGSNIYEIWVQTGVIENAKAIIPVPWSIPVTTPTNTSPNGLTPSETPAPTATSPVGGTVTQNQPPVLFTQKPLSISQSTIILLGIVPALVIILTFIVIQQRRTRSALK